MANVQLQQKQQLPYIHSYTVVFYFLWISVDILVTSFQEEENNLFTLFSVQISGNVICNK